MWEGGGGGAVPPPPPPPPPPPRADPLATPRDLCLITLSKGVLLILTVKSLFIWDNLNWLPVSMYLVFLTFKVNLFADSHDWIKFIS